MQTTAVVLSLQEAMIAKLVRLHARRLGHRVVRVGSHDPRAVELRLALTTDIGRGRIHVDPFYRPLLCELMIEGILHPVTLRYVVVSVRRAGSMLALTLLPAQDSAMFSALHASGMGSNVERVRFDCRSTVRVPEIVCDTLS